MVPPRDQLGHEVDDELAVVSVEVARGLVGEEDDRAVDEGPGEGHPLLLAPRELGRIVVGAIGEADAVEQLEGARAGRSRRAARGAPRRSRAR